jgi:hypothetical protein
VKHPAALALALLAAPGLALAAAAQAPDPFPCSLLTRLEVETVQRDKVTDAKNSEPSREPLTVSQCFYSVKTFSKSVSLEVTRRAQGGKESPAAHWKQMFTRAFDRARAKEEEEEAEKAAAAKRGGEKEKEREAAAEPRAIAGLGDEAYWIRTSLGGGLYVLKGDAYFRLSVGGPDPESVKIEKLKKLARQVLRRL